jgi:hypothetical protein
MLYIWLAYLQAEHTIRYTIIYSYASVISLLLTIIKL